LSHVVFLVFFGVAVLVVQAIHEDCVNDQNQYEADDRALLRDPKSERSASYRRHIGVEPIPEEYAAATTDDEPNEEKDEGDFQAGATMRSGVIKFHSE